MEIQRWPPERLTYAYAAKNGIIHENPLTSVSTMFEIDRVIIILHDGTFSDNGRKPPFSVILWPLEGQHGPKANQFWTLTQKVYKPTGLGSNTFYQIQIQIQIHLFQSFKYKYKYKYTGKNLIKYKYIYKYKLSNTNTNTHWGWDKIVVIWEMTKSNSFYCKKIVLFIRISLKIVSKGPIYNELGCLHWFWCWLGTE